MSRVARLFPLANRKWKKGRCQPFNTYPGGVFKRTEIMTRILLCAMACLLPIAVFAEAPKMANGMVVDDDGMTLYTFDKDSEGKSACNGSCADNWPALFASDTDKGSGDWSIVTRPNSESEAEKVWSTRIWP